MTDAGKQKGGKSTAGGQLLARARYNNLAEATDELSFRQGDIVTVLNKDHNGQADWWLCELRGQVGMVPANYFEIFHDHGDAYDFPVSRSAHTTPVPPPMSQEDGPLYDFPPEIEATDRDYDLPPPEPLEQPDYDRPLSSARSSVKSSSASSVSKLNRLSQASAASSNASNSLYDVPPDPSELYDFPKASQVPSGRGPEEDEKGPMMVAIDVSLLYDSEAEDLLANYRQLISATYENLFQSVYGTEAYWGSDNKPKRSSTLQRAITASKHFDRALLALLEFGKGVANTIESSSSDSNFRKKYGSAYRGLLGKRQEIVAKLEVLSLEVDSITATVKNLLEVARTIPSAVTEFTVLVQANKALLFKQSATDPNTLPVITKNEVKSRPLPELPVPPEIETRNNRDSRDSIDDYACIPTDEPPRPVTPRTVANGTKPTSSEESSLDWNYASKKRNPNDNLPPLPHATLPRPAKSEKQDSVGQTHKSPYGSRVDLIEGRKSPVPGHRSPPYGSRVDLVEGRRSPLQNSPYSSRTRVLQDMDQDQVDGGPHVIKQSGGLRTNTHLHSRPAFHRRASSPANHHIRQQSTGSISGSSDESNPASSLRRVNSTELLDTPYGRPVANGYNPRPASPKPLRQEDRELLDRFSKQMDLIIPSLRDSVDVFLDCLKGSEPPRDFVTKSKLSVVAAYKLVYIADALTQKILHNDTKTAILSSSNRLTESVKALVSDTKTAALQYPSVIALDKMGESLKKVFPAALDLVNSVKSQSTMV